MRATNFQLPANMRTMDMKCAIHIPTSVHVSSYYRCKLHAPSRQGMGMTGPPMRKLFIYTVHTGLLMTGLSV